MTVTDTEKDEPLPMLRLITGGKGNPPSKGNNWLKDLQKNSVFTCKKKGTHAELELYIVAFKHEKTMVLVDGLNSNPRRAVDPEGFCNLYSLFEIIEEGGERPEGVNNDSSRTVRSGGVGHDEDAPRGQPTDEGP
jgi:hypothetical protein